MSVHQNSRWTIRMCEGCNKQYDDRIMGALHTACPNHPEPDSRSRSKAPAYRKVDAVPRELADQLAEALGRALDGLEVAYDEDWAGADGHPVAEGLRATMDVGRSALARYHQGETNG
jgi:hypothetical protein